VVLGDGTSSDVHEGMCSAVIGVGNHQVVGIYVLEDFEFMHELIGLHSVSIKDLGFASLEDDFITSNRDDYVQGCVRKGIRIRGRSGWRPGALVLWDYIYRGWWCWSSNWNWCLSSFGFWGRRVFDRQCWRAWGVVVIVE